MKTYREDRPLCRFARVLPTMALVLSMLILPSNVPAQVPGKNVLYTTDADFDQGTMVSVNHDAPNNDQLQLDSPTEPFPFINVAASGRGTVVRANTETGEIVGEYRTAPEGRGLNPSRTTVDLFGNVWTANRNEVGKIDGVPHGSAVKIGLIVGGTRVDGSGSPDAGGGFLAPPFSYNTCADRNDDGLIRTSMGLGDILDWPDNSDGEGGADGLVEDAVDECILIYQRLYDAEQARHVSVDADNNVWVGGYPFDYRMFYKLDGASGAILDSFDARDIGCGGYGGLVDGNGILWSVGGPLLRYDPATRTGFCVRQYGYGLGIDTNGYLWMSIWDGGIVKIAPDGTVVPGFPKHTYPPSLTTASPAAASMSPSMATRSPAASSASPAAVAGPPSGASAAPTTLANGDPATFQAAPVDDWVQSSSPWMPGATVSLTIEDGGAVVYIDSQTADTQGNFNFSLEGFDLEPGHVVTVSDGTTTKTHTVIDIIVSSIDTGADQVHGLASPGARVWAWVSLFDEGAGRWVTADSGGNWMADFSVAEEGRPAYNITEVTRISVDEFDDDGDATQSRFGPPVQQNRGVAVTPIDNQVWVANSGVGTVTRLDNDGNVIKVIDTGVAPTGVAVDAAGKVWATNLGSDNTVRIDPNAGPDGLGAVDLTVDLGPWANPYNYSDMTGAVVVGSTSPQGFWTVVQDSGIPGFEWGRITWNREPQGSEPQGTEIVVEARTADTEAGLGGATFQVVANDELFSLFGRYIEVRATLKAALGATSPVLSDIRIQPAYVEVAVDIKPESCPNPLSVKEKGALSVAIVGTEEFDVTQVDPATVTLAGVSPLRWDVEDSAIP